MAMTRGGVFIPQAGNPGNTLLSVAQSGVRNQYAQEELGQQRFRNQLDMQKLRFDQMQFDTLQRQRQADARNRRFGRLFEAARINPETANTLMQDPDYAGLMPEGFQFKKPAKDQLYKMSGTVTQNTIDQFAANPALARFAPNLVVGNQYSIEMGMGAGGQANLRVFEQKEPEEKTPSAPTASTQANKILGKIDAQAPVSQREVATVNNYNRRKREEMIEAAFARGTFGSFGGAPQVIMRDNAEDVKLVQAAAYAKYPDYELDESGFAKVKEQRPVKAAVANAQPGAAAVANAQPSPSAGNSPAGVVDVLGPEAFENARKQSGISVVR